LEFQPLHNNRINYLKWC